MFSERRSNVFLLCSSVVSLWNIDVYSKRLVFKVVLIYTPSTFSCIFLKVIGLTACDILEVVLGTSLPCTVLCSCGQPDDGHILAATCNKCCLINKSQCLD
jgi:hypothetical protein